MKQILHLFHNIAEITINLLQTKTLFTIETKIGFTDDDFLKFDQGQIIWSTLVKNWLNWNLDSLYKINQLDDRNLFWTSNADR